MSVFVIATTRLRARDLLFSIGANRCIIFVTIPRQFFLVIVLENFFVSPCCLFAVHDSAPRVQWDWALSTRDPVFPTHLVCNDQLGNKVGLGPGICNWCVKEALVGWSASGGRSLLIPSGRLCFGRVDVLDFERCLSREACCLKSLSRRGTAPSTRISVHLLCHRQRQLLRRRCKFVVELGPARACAL